MVIWGVVGILLGIVATLGGYLLSKRVATVCTHTNVALVALALVAVGWLAYCASGLVVCTDEWRMFFIEGSVGLVACAVATRPALRVMWERSWPFVAPLVRVAVAVAAIPVALYLIETPYNPNLQEMPEEFLDLNLMLFATVVIGVWFLAQRRLASCVVVLAVCLTFGLAQYFVLVFKSQVITPADLMSLQTAVAVSAGYTYTLTDAPLTAFAVFNAYWALSLFAPAPQSKIYPISGVTRFVLNTAVGLMLLTHLVSWFDTTDLEKDCNVDVDIWFTVDSYQRNGSVPSFLKLLQEIEPEVPEGYSTQEADRTMGTLARDWDARHPDYPQTLAQSKGLALEETGSDELPCVVVVMNETFSDLSIFSGMENYDGLTVFDSIPGARRGFVYVSTRGGGTCNSEFEYLTTSTIAFVSKGVNPYVYYDLSKCESLPRYFGALGYDTLAMHPENASNWRREIVYRQLSFDRFLSIDAFEGAPVLRGKVTDAATYDLILEQIEADSSAPTFVFDVTMQNHSGYDSGELAYDHRFDDVTVCGETLSDMDEFLTCIAISETQLADFIHELESVDRKVIVVFFGDHQPYMDDEIARLSYGVDIAEMSLEEIQTRYATPYLVWANYDLDAGRLEELPTEMSLSELSARTAYLAGLPLTDYQKAVLEMSERTPIVNLNGYTDTAGIWHPFGEAAPAQGALQDRAFIQYASLFDPEGNAAFSSFDPEE